VNFAEPGPPLAVPDLRLRTIPAEMLDDVLALVLATCSPTLIHSG